MGATAATTARAIVPNAKTVERFTGWLLQPPPSYTSSMAHRPPELPGRETVVETACPLDCPDSCSLAVTVRNGRILKIDGSRLTATTAGYICAQDRRFGERVSGDGRLQRAAHPGHDRRAVVPAFRHVSARAHAVRGADRRGQSRPVRQDAVCQL